MQKIQIPGKHTFTFHTSENSCFPSLPFKETRVFLRVKDIKAQGGNRMKNLEKRTELFEQSGRESRNHGKSLLRHGAEETGRR